MTQCLEAKVEDIIVSTRSRDAASLGACSFHKPWSYLFYYCLIRSLHSPECLTREALLCDAALDFVSICFSTSVNGLNKWSVTCHYDLHAFAEQFFKLNTIMWQFLETWTIFKIVPSEKHTDMPMLSVCLEHIWYIGYINSGQWKRLDNTNRKV